MTAANAYDVTVVPRIAIHLPLEVPEPEGFVVERPETWPQVPGRLEYVAGRLEFMPPRGEVQQCVASDVTAELTNWRRSHPEFVVGSNEAGMLLGGEVRGADAAVWRLTSPRRPGFAREPPVLAVEITGAEDTVDALQAKAQWYLAHGVVIVWLVVPETRSVHVITGAGTIEVRDRVPESPLLPGLSPAVGDFFRQL